MRAKLKFLLAALTTLALGVVAVAATADEDGSSQPPGSDLSVATAIEPAAAAAIARLAEPRVAGDELPGDLAERAEDRPLFGINPELTRRAIANTTLSLYLLPGSGHVCSMLTDSGAGAALNCDSTADVAAGLSRPATVVLSTGDIAVYGLVADGIDSVTLATGVADTAAVDVEGNGYLAVVESGTALRHVAYEGPSGQVALEIVDPSAP
ncbi:MAG: hypothetical protein GXY03_11950 [Solirubrobacterales bacterium]|nr:hypothetical protein [Solirubrobacterales bacterium]